MNKTDTNLLEKLTNAVSYTYVKDGVAPNVLVSSLPKGKYYVSVNRYPSGMKSKTIVFKKTGSDLAELLFQASQFVLKNKKRNPIDELRDFVEGPNKLEVKSVNTHSDGDFLEDDGCSIDGNGCFCDISDGTCDHF